MAEWLISMLRAKALQQNSLEMTVQYVDDHNYPSPSHRCHRARLTARKALLWNDNSHAARCLYILGQAFHKAFSSPTCPRRTPSKNWKSTLDNVSFLWLWCCGCWREVSAPFLAFFCLASSNEHHCSMTISIQRRCSKTISIQRFLLQYSPVFLHLVLYVPVVAHWCLLPCTCEG